MSFIENAEYSRRLDEALEGEWLFDVVEHHVFDAELVVVKRLVAGLGSAVGRLDRSL